MTQRKLIFLSYVSEDKEKVEALRRFLEGHGFLVWKDSASLELADDWLEQARECIEEQASAFIACFSKHTQTRPNNHQNTEIKIALERRAMQPAGTKWFFPALLDAGIRPPKWLSPTYSLENCHAVELYGPEHDSQLQELATMLHRIPPNSQGIVYANPTTKPTEVASRSVPLGSHPVDAVKLYMQYPAVRFTDLQALFMQWQNQIVRSIFAVQAPKVAPSEAKHLKERLWEDTSKLALALAYACLSRDESFHIEAEKVLKSVLVYTDQASTSTEPTDFAWLAPTNLLVGSCFGAVKSHNWKLVHDLSLRPGLFSHRPKREVPILQLVHPWRAFRDDPHGKEFLEHFSKESSRDFSENFSEEPSSRSEVLSEYSRTTHLRPGRLLPGELARLNLFESFKDQFEGPDFSSNYCLTQALLSCMSYDYIEHTGLSYPELRFAQHSSRWLPIIKLEMSQVDPFAVLEKQIKQLIDGGLFQGVYLRAENAIRRCREINTAMSARTI